jgi:phage antirepressor YoqD-like protein
MLSPPLRFSAPAGFIWRRGMNESINALVEAEVERRLSDPVYLREANQRLIEKVQRLEREAEALVPVKTFYDAVTKSDDWMEMAAAVKLLAYKGWGRNKTFSLLRDRKIFRYNNEPYQQYVERGCFKTVEELFENAYGRTGIYRKTMVSNKGLEFIKKLIDTAENE